ARRSRPAGRADAGGFLSAIFSRTGRRCCAMSLFWAEHQKLWRAGLTRLATGLFLALLTALQLWSYQSANYGTMKADGSRYLDGPANIRERQAYARQWEVLTDETLQQMVSALQTARAADPEMDSERGTLYALNALLGSYW